MISIKLNMQNTHIKIYYWNLWFPQNNFITVCCNENIEMI